MQNKDRVMNAQPSFEERLRRIIREEVRKVYKAIREEIESGKSPPWPTVTYYKDKKRC